MFSYLDNQLQTNWLLVASSVTTTTSVTTADLRTANGPVLVAISAPAGGSGTLVPTFWMSGDDSTYVAVPTTAILDATTGLATTVTNITTTAHDKKYYLKRDELMRYFKVILTPTPSATITVNVLEAHLKSYTSQSV